MNDEKCLILSFLLFSLLWSLSANQLFKSNQMILQITLIQMNLKRFKTNSYKIMIIVGQLEEPNYYRNKSWLFAYLILHHLLKTINVTWKAISDPCQHFLYYGHKLVSKNIFMCQLEVSRPTFFCLSVGLFVGRSLKQDLLWNSIVFKPRFAYRARVDISPNTQRNNPKIFPYLNGSFPFRIFLECV